MVSLLILTRFVDGKYINNIISLVESITQDELDQLTTIFKKIFEDQSCNVKLVGITPAADIIQSIQTQLDEITQYKSRPITDTTGKNELKK